MSNEQNISCRERFAHRSLLIANNKTAGLTGSSGRRFESSTALLGSDRYV